MELQIVQVCLLLFVKASVIELNQLFRDLEGHFLILKAVVQDSPVILIKYCAPNDESSQVRVLLEINGIVTSLDLEQNTSIIWGRDFNLILYFELDNDGGNPRLKIQSLS